MPKKSITNNYVPTMKYKCIKSDPLGWIKAGRVYNLRRMNSKYYIEGKGIAISEANMKEMFVPMVPR